MFAMFSQTPGADSQAHRRMYLFLIILTVASALAFQGWRTLLNNFAVEQAGIDGFEMGVIQSVREIPGFLALLVVYLLLIIREHRLAALSVAVLGLGVATTGFFPSFAGITITTLIMSFGFHYFETLNMSLTLQHFDLREAPLVSGKLRAAMSAANLVAGGLIFVLAIWLNYQMLFLIMGGVVFLVGAGTLFSDPSSKETTPQKKRMVLKKRYWLFYALTFLAGARRQVFVAFAVFLLVQKFEYSVQAVTALFVVNNLINIFLSPLIGRAVNRFGERNVLGLEYFSLILVFAGYALTESAWFAAVLYILDHIFFNFAFAMRTYFQKIADPADIAPSMAVGFTINHIAAVVIPVLGGLAWLENYRIVFWGGAVLSLGSLVLTRCIPSKARLEELAGE